ncbi:chalcone isomerase family protein [Desulforhopalus singaporensis]|uniref:Chalcone isomerase-like n=1 Tax=Desulforhopalus singaporensis TaxID=91360 RepID=A0A1H0L1L0_9BACT|nr:chalcone isomerase family protein [Desulforhopalus singaporensis]SDO62109.1 Chalcone isomerase-like [Desulforhopalus singaporensis]
MRYLIVFALLLGCLPAQAKEISGVQVQETVRTPAGRELRLNGAGIRAKFVFDIYIAALYLGKQTAAAEEVLTDPGPKRVVMHFLHKHVAAEKLVAAWNEGFAANNSTETLDSLKADIAAFNGFFTDVNRGDRVILDFDPTKGTSVTIAGQKKGTIANREFYPALLKIWLGDKPVTEKLKKQLLGRENHT